MTSTDPLLPIEPSGSSGLFGSRRDTPRIPCGRDDHWSALPENVLGAPELIATDEWLIRLWLAHRCRLPAGQALTALVPGLLVVLGDPDDPDRHWTYRLVEYCFCSAEWRLRWPD